YVDEFDLEGRLVARGGRSRELDEPWGVALAPEGFGRFGGDLLVASFGSGQINAYERRGGGWLLRGRLPVRVPGVWGIAFGVGGDVASRLEADLADRLERRERHQVRGGHDRRRPLRQREQSARLAVARRRREVALAHVLVRKAEPLGLRSEGGQALRAGDGVR